MTSAVCDLATSNVTDWNRRPVRQRVRTVSYWEEFVEKDSWYVKELTRDVPDEEMHAVLTDDDMNDDVQSGDDECDVEVEDPEFLMDEDEESSSDGSIDCDEDESASDGGCESSEDGTDDEGTDGLLSESESDEGSDFSTEDTAPSPPDSPRSVIGTLA